VHVRACRAGWLSAFLQQTSCPAAPVQVELQVFDVW
jgi:hypothetical protein